MEECSKDCLQYISTYVPKSDWPALAFVSQRWYAIVMMIVPLSLPVSQCEHACYQGDFLAVTRAARIEPVYFGRGVKRAGQGGHYQLGKWLIKNKLGTIKDFFRGACRGGHLTIVEEISNTLSSPLEGGESEPFIRAAFKSGNMELVLFLEKRLSRFKLSVWDEGFGAACKYNHQLLIARCLEESLKQTTFAEGLCGAMASGDKALVTLLIEQGAKLNDECDHIESAFASGDPGMVELVSPLENHTSCGPYYWSRAFDGACRSGSKELMESVAKKATYHNRALQHAAIHGELDVVRWILSLGKVIFRPLQLAKIFKKRHLECAAELINHFLGTHPEIIEKMSSDDPHIRGWIATRFGISE